jgi:peptidoglycan/LPS O-acetylase OafA/YrhL
MAVPWILSNELVTQTILPFVLVFVLIFAILDRIKILGEDKRQINAIVSLVIALLFVTFGNAVGMVTQLVPFLVVLSVIILVFLILWGFIAAGKDGFSVNKGIRIAAGIIITVALIVAVIIVTGAGDTFSKWFSGSNSNTIVGTIVFIVIIGGAMAVVLSSGKKS